MARAAAPMFKGLRVRTSTTRTRTSSAAVSKMPFYRPKAAGWYPCGKAQAQPPAAHALPVVPMLESNLGGSSCPARVPESFSGEWICSAISCCREARCTFRVRSD
jgi:hypothetical protein